MKIDIGKRVSRRLLVGSQSGCRRLLSIVQETDASIYITNPDFAQSRFADFSGAPGKTLQFTEITEAGKLSVHGSGIAHVRPGAGGDVEMRLSGNFLLSRAKDGLGVRHVCTAFLTQPTLVVAGARSTDVVLSEHESPSVFVFWAVPSTRQIDVRVDAAFHIDDLETVEFATGFGGFGLNTHSIVWFAYRTKHMTRWPANSLFAFHDGFLVPIMVGTGEGQMRIELRPARYSYKDDVLSIGLPFPPDGRPLF